MHHSCIDKLFWSILPLPISWSRGALHSWILLCCEIFAVAVFNHFMFECCISILRLSYSWWYEDDNINFLALFSGRGMWLLEWVCQKMSRNFLRDMMTLKSACIECRFRLASPCHFKCECGFPGKLMSGVFFDYACICDSLRRSFW